MRTLSEEMAQITSRPRQTTIAPIWPDAIYAFIDNLTIWVPEPLDSSRRTGLLPYGSIDIQEGPSRFDGWFKQRLQIRQPSSQTLRALMNVRHMINYVELALDWTFRTEIERDAAVAYFDDHHVKLWHRDEVRYASGTRYTGRRKAPNNLVTYRHLPCKITGEINCIHHDWRVRGRAACQHAEIDSVEDLIDFDYRDFWKKRLILATIDRLKFGRAYRKWHMPGSTPRWPAVSRSGRVLYDKDHRTATILLNLDERMRKTQEVLDHYGKKFRVRDCLIRLDVDHLLPSATLL